MQHTNALALRISDARFFLQCVLVPRSAVVYPQVWYAGHWPESVAIDAPGVFCELLTRRSVTSWFLRDAGGVLQPGVQLPRDCALIEQPQCLFPN